MLDPTPRRLGVQPRAAVHEGERHRRRVCAAPGDERDRDPGQLVEAIRFVAFESELRAEVREGVRVYPRAVRKEGLQLAPEFCAVDAERREGDRVCGQELRTALGEAAGFGREGVADRLDACLRHDVDALDELARFASGLAESEAAVDRVDRVDAQQGARHRFAGEPGLGVRVERLRRVARAQQNLFVGRRTWAELRL